MPKIIFTSDTHNLHRHLDMPEGDILVHAGDMLMDGKGDELERFGRWLTELPYKHKLVIAGNHDFIFERKPEVAKVLLGHGGYGITYLQDESITIDGIKFYGSPWQPRFFDWAFNVDRGEAIKKYWDLIPNDTNVLITHGPPHYVLDRVLGKHVGCEELMNAINRVKPKVHVFGHIHCGAGYDTFNGTQFINASAVNERYQVVYKPYEIEL